MIFGPPDVARIMQLLEDGEQLRIGARRHDVSPSIVSPLADPEGGVAGVATPLNFQKNSGHPRGRCPLCYI